MMTMTPTQAAAVLSEIRASWPQREITADQAAVWLDTLAQVRDTDVARAAIRHLRSQLDFPPSHKEFLNAARDEAARTAEMRALAAGPAGPCPECGGDEFVELGGSSPAGVRNDHRPCSRCMPLMFVRWQGGHLRPGHHCGDCRDLQKGAPAQRSAARGRFLEQHVPVDLEPSF